MKHLLNDGSIEENAVQNRFTAYLKVSLKHNRDRYICKLNNKQNMEIAYTENESYILELHADDPFSELFAQEFEDIRLLRALSCLREIEHEVLLQHLLHNHSLKEIAALNNIPYATIKSHYRRALENIRKELEKDEF